MTSITGPRLTIAFKEESLQSDLLTYHDWSKAMQTFLKVHHVWKCVVKPKARVKTTLSEELDQDPAVAAAKEATAELVAKEQEATDEEVLAFCLIESNCTAETRRM